MLEYRMMHARCRAVALLLLSPLCAAAVTSRMCDSKRRERIESGVGNGGIIGEAAYHRRRSKAWRRRMAKAKSISISMEKQQWRG